MCRSERLCQARPMRQTKPHSVTPTANASANMSKSSFLGILTELIILERAANTHIGYISAYPLGLRLCIRTFLHPLHICFAYFCTVHVKFPCFYF